MQKNIYKFIIIASFFVLSSIYYRSFSYADISLMSRVRGKILLEVEKNGEAWYVYPNTDKRYYLGRPNDAFDLMKETAIGISNEEIKEVPIGILEKNSYSERVFKDDDQDGLYNELEDAINTDKNNTDTDTDGYSDLEEVLNNYNPKGEGRNEINKALREKLSGMILLQVEQNGEAWYVNPDDQKRYFLGRPEDAFNVMRSLGLGISDYDISFIPEHLVDETKMNEYLIENNTTLVNSNTRKYSDTNFPVKFSYPKNWRIQKDSQRNNVLFLGDYNKNVFSENKASINLNFITADEDLSLDNFEVKEKDKAIKTENEIIEVNGYQARQERFEYKELKSYEVTTVIQKNQREFLHILFVVGGSPSKYDKILKNLLESIDFREKTCSSCGE